MEEINKKLDEAKNKYTNVMILGFDENGNVQMDSTFTGLHELQYLLNRVSFELYAYEMSKRGEQK